MDLTEGHILTAMVGFPSKSHLASALDRIRSRRLELGISQAAVAEMVGVNASYVGLVERGERVPSLDVLFGFCAALDLEPGALFSNRENGSAHREVAQIVALMSGFDEAQRVALVKIARSIAVLRGAQDQRSRKRPQT